MNAFQTWSGAADVVPFTFIKEGMTHTIVELAADDIINGQAEDPGDTNQHSANIGFTITAHYLGPVSDD